MPSFVNKVGINSVSAALNVHDCALIIEENKNNPTVKNRNLTVADFTAENSVYGNPEPDIVIWLRMKD
ncbi:MAG: hypothetical protein IJY78_04415, partial [Bacteroidaceae bacterium]|nr:hypothetical protein [Bacteroidaceae bacterium]